MPCKVQNFTDDGTACKSCFADGLLREGIADQQLSGTSRLAKTAGTPSSSVALLEKYAKELLRGV